jgi:hypothetical protein
MLEDFLVAIRLAGVKPRVSRQVEGSGELGLHRVEKDLAAQEESIGEELDDLRTECSRLLSLQQHWESKHRRTAEQMNLF